MTRRAPIRRTVLACVLVVGSSGIATGTAAAAPSPPAIAVWYGDVQRVDALGRSQDWANVLGRASDPDGTVASLGYTVNGGPTRALSMGPSHLRLPRAGDFNVEIDRDSLAIGENQVVITAVDDTGLRSSRTVTLVRSARTTTPIPTSVDWSRASSAAEVADVVDGRWSTGPAGVRIVENGYDRLLGIGDVTWQDYEMEVPVTVHKRHSSNAAVGMLMRWTGHTEAPPHQAGMQPLLGWRPSGALAWYRFRPKAAPQVEIARDDESPLAVDRSGFDLVAGTTYTFRASVRRVSSGDAYTFDVFRQGSPASSGVSLSAVDTAPSKSAGSLLLIAHRMTVTFGTVSVRPIGATGNTAPIARNDSATVPSGGSVDVAVLANDSDVDGSLVPSSVAIRSGPTAGASSVDAGTGTVRYTPQPGFVGTDSFTYTVDDEAGATSNVATVSVTVTDGSTSTGIVSDEFSDTALGAHWRLIDPRGTATVDVSGGRLHVGVPAGTSHDLWSKALWAPRLVQDVDDVGFDVHAKIDSEVASRYQMQGLVVQQDADDLFRFDVHHDGSTVRLFVARILAGKGTVLANVPTSRRAPYWLRVTRTGSSYAFSVSSDGTAWETVAAVDQPLVVRQLGVFAGNHGSTSIPAHVAAFDHVREGSPG